MSPSRKSIELLSYPNKLTDINYLTQLNSRTARQGAVLYDDGARQQR